MPECTRCHKLVDQTFVIQRGPALSFVEVDLSKPPTYEAPCGDCLTDREIVNKLLPIVSFVLEAEMPFTAGELRAGLGQAHAWAEFRAGIADAPSARRKMAVNAIHTAQAIANLQSKNAELRQISMRWQAIAEGAQRDLLVPNEFRCALCNYRISAEVSIPPTLAKPADYPTCPIDSSVMFRVTWREACLTASRIASRARKRCEILEQAWPDSHPVPIGEEAEDKSIEEKIERLQELGLIDIAFGSKGVRLSFLPKATDADIGVTGPTYLDIPVHYPTLDEGIDAEYLKRKAE